MDSRKSGQSLVRLSLQRAIVLNCSRFAWDSDDSVEDSMLSKDRTALIVIDVQEKLFQHMYEKEALENSLIRLIQGASVLQLPIVWAEQYPEGMGPTLSSLQKHLPDAPIPKKTFSCYAHPPLADAIDQTGANQFLLGGIETHVCVYQTTKSLLKQGHSVEIVTDCVSSRTQANHQLGLRRAESEGAQLTSVEMCLFELLQKAEGDAFRKILPIVK